MHSQIEAPTERRSSSESAIITLITAVHTDVKELRSTLDTHMRDETHELEIAKLMILAFPEGDPAGHRKTHEASIVKAEASAAFWKKMEFELARAGLLVFLVWAAFALWKEFLQGPSK